jgi:hypothetical protein
MRTVFAIIILGSALISAVHADAAAPLPARIDYVAGSTQKVCQLTGEIDRQFNQPTLSQTETRFGLVGTDEGPPFEHNGTLYFPFGDSGPTPMFRGRPNGDGIPPRLADDNDSIGYAERIAPNNCIQLGFIHYPNGAYKNPVVLDASGKPAITLRTNETPHFGISVGGQMYVLFLTDNFLSNPPNGPSHPNGGASRSVMAVSTDNAQSFHYLYDFSKGPGAKFIMNAIQAGQDGYIYFWGTEGAKQYRRSPVYLARLRADAIATGDGRQYFYGFGPEGGALFARDNESAAVPLFHDYIPGDPNPHDCAGEVGVEWNNYLRRWVMLYNCANASPDNPPGVYMRTALLPWGPWSAPQTIFNAKRDGGLCAFIHRAVTPNEPQCDNLSGPKRMDVNGGAYGPYFISRFTTGAGATSTFFYVLSTWNPYEVVIMKSTVRIEGNAPLPPIPPPHVVPHPCPPGARCPTPE